MVQNHLSALRNKHAILDRKISEEEGRPFPDTIRLHDLKKQKLRLKDTLLAEPLSNPA
ncbi:YdcH family protein [Parasphingorhabdus sp.]|uniref:YdcH family protein n=1 Tax=Parasphingorhabdus sp. TaxID=2709688 RepID=UPI002F92A209